MDFGFTGLGFKLSGFLGERTYRVQGCLVWALRFYGCLGLRVWGLGLALCVVVLFSLCSKTALFNSVTVCLFPSSCYMVISV